MYGYHSDTLHHPLYLHTIKVWWFENQRNTSEADVLPIGKDMRLEPQRVFLTNNAEQESLAVYVLSGVMTLANFILLLPQAFLTHCQTGWWASGYRANLGRILVFMNRYLLCWQQESLLDTHERVHTCVSEHSTSVPKVSGTWGVDRLQDLL